MLGSQNLVDLQSLYILIGFIGFAFFVLFICVCSAIISINRCMKDLVDLEYKKYNEQKGNNIQNTN